MPKIKSVIIFLLFAIGYSPALAQRTIDFASTPASGDAIIAGVESDQDINALAAYLGANGVANLRRAMAAKGFDFASGAVASFVTGDVTHGEVHLIAVSETMRARDWEDFGGRAIMIANASKTERFSVIVPDVAAGEAGDIAFGAIVGGYRFHKYKSQSEPITGAFKIVTTNATTARASFNSGRRHVANAVLWARDQQSEPANVLYPEEFVRRVRNEFRGVSNISISVLDVGDMERLGMGAILGVGRGSVRPPRMVIVRYAGGGANEAPIVFAGKGVTFDTGGISIKPNENMWTMKADMTGAAAVMAATMGLSKSRAPVNIVAIAALAENMPDGSAIRPGDVLRAMSGKTIEIMSTDAEGRLVLADAVHYAQQQYNPRLLVDVATLTGSVGRALGDEYAGLFTRDDDIADQLLEAGERSGEDLWRLPLHPNHTKQIASVIADVKNANTGAPGASTGAAFIGAFVTADTPWAHLDIAGVDWRFEATPTIPNGASGYGVRLLDRLARDYKN